MSLGWLESFLEGRGIRKSYLKGGQAPSQIPQKGQEENWDFLLPVYGITASRSLSSGEYLMGRHLSSQASSSSPTVQLDQQIGSIPFWRDNFEDVPNTHTHINVPFKDTAVVGAVAATQLPFRKLLWIQLCSPVPASAACREAGCLLCNGSSLAVLELCRS